MNTQNKLYTIQQLRGAWAAGKNQSAPATQTDDELVYTAMALYFSLKVVSAFLRWLGDDDKPHIESIELANANIEMAMKAVAENKTFLSRVLESEKFLQEVSVSIKD